MEEIYFYGELVQNEELDKVAKQRKKKYQEITVPKAEQSSFIEQGWELKRELKNRVILRREKEWHVKIEKLIYS